MRAAAPIVVGHSVRPVGGRRSRELDQTVIGRHGRHARRVSRDIAPRIGQSPSHAYGVRRAIPTPGAGRANLRDVRRGRAVDERVLLSCCSLGRRRVDHPDGRGNDPWAGGRADGWMGGRAGGWLRLTVRPGHFKNLSHQDVSSGQEGTATAMSCMRSSSWFIQTSVRVQRTHGDARIRHAVRHANNADDWMLEKHSLVWSLSSPSRSRPSSLVSLCSRSLRGRRLSWTKC